MEHSAILIRKLSPIEEAFTISNEASPLCVVCVLHLESGLGAREVRTALDNLQPRHLLLQAGISELSGGLYFTRLEPVLPIELEVERRLGAETWRGVAERALNTTFNKRGPLMKCWFVSGAEKEKRELIVCFHHAIIDGDAARLILHELLCLCGGVELPGPPPFSPEAPPRPSLGRLARFASRQLLEEWKYKKGGATSPIPGHSFNAILSFRLSPALSRKLALRAGREGLSLNSVLLAAISLVVLRRRHSQSGNHLARVISFASLRPASEKGLGCFISMLRLTAPFSRETTAWELAMDIRRAVFSARRRGEVSIMSFLSKYLIRMALRLQNMRLGVTALSFIGKLELEPAYGPIRLDNVMAFITNNCFGPEFSAFGKILFGSIGLDFNYLTAEMSEAQAGLIVKEIREILENMAELP